MEFGNSGGVFGTWSLNSNTHKGGPHPPGQGALPPAFISMPHKQRMLEVLQSNATCEKIQFLCCKLGSSDAPAGDCTALHVPQSLELCSPGPVVIGGTVALFGGVPIFDENFDFTGSFGPAMFTGISFEPPDENGG